MEGCTSSPGRLMPSALNTAAPLYSLQISKDKLNVRYVGEARTEYDVGAVRADHPVPQNLAVYYFEATVDMPPTSLGKMRVGFCSHSFKAGRHFGAEKGSFAYCGDDGAFRHEDNVREAYGHPFRSGDVVGAGIVLSRGALFFTHNGQNLGVARSGVGPRTHVLFPAVSLHSPGESLKLNFGAEPFMFDVAGVVAEERAKEEGQVSDIEVPAAVSHELVRGTLAHYGYARTLAAFEQASGIAAARREGLRRRAARAVDGEGTLALRAGVRTALLAGNVEAAEDLMRRDSIARRLLPEDRLSTHTWRDLVWTALSCQGVVELARAGDAPRALAFARERIAPFVSAPCPLAHEPGAGAGHDACKICVHVQGMVRECMGLLAYPDAATSPLAHLLAPSERERTADIVNSAILTLEAALGEGEHPPGAFPDARSSGSTPPALVRCLHQLCAARHLLHELNGRQGEPFSLRRALGDADPDEPMAGA
ncbi:unnamed protein product [Pedinophyceae sp. YPF-701]|nr:unnamed protein product [Pedinophyceae sp. YPF-701]